jgi:hypothetical protein
MNEWSSEVNECIIYRRVTPASRSRTGCCLGSSQRGVMFAFFLTCFYPVYNQKLCYKFFRLFPVSWNKGVCFKNLTFHQNSAKVMVNPSACFDGYRTSFRSCRVAMEIRRMEVSLVRTKDVGSPLTCRNVSNNFGPCVSSVRINLYSKFLTCSQTRTFSLK